MNKKPKKKDWPKELAACNDSGLVTFVAEPTTVGVNVFQSGNHASASVMWDALLLDGVTIFAKWLASAGCEELKMELSGVPLERPMSSGGLGQADDDDDDDE